MLRSQENVLGIPTLARDRPSRYGGLGGFRLDQRSRGTGPRATVSRSVFKHRRAGACPPPCCELRQTCLAPQRSRGTGPRATVTGGFRLNLTLARDRPSRYGEVAVFVSTGASRGPGPRAAVSRSVFKHRRAGACPPPCRALRKTCLAT